MFVDNLKFVLTFFKVLVSSIDALDISPDREVHGGTTGTRKYLEVYMKVQSTPKDR